MGHVHNKQTKVCGFVKMIRLLQRPGVDGACELIKMSLVLVYLDYYGCFTLTLSIKVVGVKKNNVLKHQCTNR